MIPGEDDCPIIGEPLKTGVKSKNGQGVPASRKADEVRLYALRGGLTTKMVRTAHFRSHEVFRGDHRSQVIKHIEQNRRKTWFSSDFLVILDYPAKPDTEIPNSEFLIPNFPLSSFEFSQPVRYSWFPVITDIGSIHLPPCFTPRWRCGCWTISAWQGSEVLPITAPSWIS